MTRLYAFALSSSLILGIVAASPRLAADEKAPTTTDADAPETGDKTPAEAKWKPLFDGKTLDGWKSIDFGGEGEVTVKEGEIQLPPGNNLTGIVWTKEFPKTNFELRWEARKVDGTDFFASGTFPVGESHCTFVTGGWGGGLIGLSNVDGYDASENNTSDVFKFEKGKAYLFRVRVTPDRIVVWIDDKKIVDEDIVGKAIGLRWEVEPTRPVGFSSFATHGAIKKIEYRKLNADDAAKPDEVAKPEDATPEKEER